MDERENLRNIQKDVATNAQLRKNVAASIKEIDLAEAKLKKAMAEFAKMVQEGMSGLEVNNAIDKEPFCLIEPVISNNSYQDGLDAACGEMELKLTIDPEDGSGITEWHFELKGKFA